MKLGKCIQIFVATTLVLPIAAFSQVGANPFGAAPKTTTAVVDMTKAEALAVLTSNDRAKVQSDHLTKILDKALNTPETKADRIIIEYVQNVVTEAQVMSKSARKKTNAEIEAKRKSDSLEFNRIKQNSRNKFDSTEVELIQDYELLPLSVISIKNKKALVKLLKDPNVKGIFPNKAWQANLAQSLPLIGQPIAENLGFTGVGTTVVVLDSGVNYNQPAFGNCTSPGQPSTTCKVIFTMDVPGDGSNNYNHGSNVSGIVAGVAPGAKLAVLDVFTNGETYPEYVLYGINWAIQNKNSYNIVAINMSLGEKGYRSGVACDSYASLAMLAARNNNILPIVAAGNGGFSDGIGSPACGAGAVSVGAVYDGNSGPTPGFIIGTDSLPTICNDSITSADKIACFSNSSSLLTLLAPGGLTTAAGIEDYGTSMAAPHVAGAVAVLSAAFPNESAEEILVRITNSGVPVRDQRNGITKPRLNLRAALGNLIPPDSIPIPPGSTTNEVDITPIVDILLLSN